MYYVHVKKYNIKTKQKSNDDFRIILCGISSKGRKCFFVRNVQKDETCWFDRRFHIEML